MNLALSLVFMIVLTGCLPTGGKSKLAFEPLANTDIEVEPDPEIDPDEAITFTQLKTQILATKCIGCHKGFAEEKKVLKYIEVGDPENSELFQVVKDGSMPKNGKALSTKELAVVRGYISSLKTSEPTEPTPIPAEAEPLPVPVPGPTPTEPEMVNFEILKDKILTQKCMSCHKGFAEEKKILKYVEVGDAYEASELYQVLKDGSMPKNESPLSNEDLEFVKKYIEGLKESVI